MERMSALDFVAGLRGAPSHAQRNRLSDKARIAGIAAECSPVGAALLLGIARVDAALDGFPRRVPLVSADGRCLGLEAISVGGRWKFGGTEEAVSALPYRMPPCRAASVRAFALGALGVPVTPEADAALVRVAGWDGDLEATLDASLARLHEHSVRSVAAYAGDVLHDLGLLRDNLTAVVAASWRRCELFPALAHESMDGVGDTLSRAASVHRLDGIAALLDPSLAPAGARMPDPSVEVTAALRRALAGIWPDAIDAVRALAAAGADLGPDGDGRTPLHALANVADLRYANQVVPLAELLVELGVDPAATDEGGKTAADLYADYTGQQDPGDHDGLMRALTSRGRSRGFD